MSAVRRLTIIGMGLIGGSMGLALKAAKGQEIEITGIDTNIASLQQAKELGAADFVTTDMCAGAATADVVFICTPVLQIVPIIKTIAACLKAGAIVTDVGSTKGFLLAQLTGVLRPDNPYIAGHPMAGRELSGITAANNQLFRDKWYILTAPPATWNIADGAVSEIAELNKTELAIRTMEDLIGLTGAKVTVMDVASHDWCTAVISHTPHIAAAALVNLLDRSRQMGEHDCGPVYEKLAAGGFRDTTRIASSDPDMWADICLTNSDAIVENLIKLQTLLGEIVTDIKQRDRQAIHGFFATAKKRRDAIAHKESGSQQ